jgi:hypothetical protein
MKYLLLKSAPTLFTEKKKIKLLVKCYYRNYVQFTILTISERNKLLLTVKPTLSIINLSTYTAHILLNTKIRDLIHDNVNNTETKSQTFRYRSIGS